MNATRRGVGGARLLATAGLLLLAAASAPAQTPEPAGDDRAEAIEALAEELAGETAPSPTPERQLRSLEQQVAALEQALKAAGQAVEESRRAIADQAERLDTELKRMDSLALRLDSVAEQSKRQVEGQAEHASRIEENSVKLFETLVGIDATEETLQRLAAQVKRLPAPGRRALVIDGDGDDEHAAAARVRLLLALVLAVLFPLGVLLLLDGRGGEADGAEAGAGRLLAWFGGGLGYLVIYLVMQAAGAGVGPLSALLVQLPLAAAFGLLVCSAMAPRLPPLGNLLAATLVTALPYALFGHWAGGGWLAGLGFDDPAAVTGFALLGGLTALVLAVLLRPPAAAPPPPRSWPAPWPTAGLLLLWTAWLIAVPVRDGDLAGNLWLGFATLAGALGAAVGVLLAGSLVPGDRGWPRRLPGALLAAVVAVTATRGFDGAIAALLVGLVAGLLQDLAARLLLRRLGESAELALALTLAGSVGTLLPGLLGPDGLFSAGAVALLLPQLVGFGTAAALALAFGSLMGLPAWLSGRRFSVNSRDL